MENDLTASVESETYTDWVNCAGDALDGLMQLAKDVPKMEFEGQKWQWADLRIPVPDGV